MTKIVDDMIELLFNGYFKDIPFKTVNNAVISLNDLKQKLEKEENNPETLLNYDQSIFTECTHVAMHGIYPTHKFKHVNDILLEFNKLKRPKPE